MNIVMTSSRSNVHHGLNIIMLPITGMSLPLGMVCVLSIGYINFTTLFAAPATRRGEEGSGLGDEVSQGGGIQLSHRQGTVNVLTSPISLSRHPMPRSSLKLTGAAL